MRASEHSRLLGRNPQSGHGEPRRRRAFAPIDVSGTSLPWLGWVHRLGYPWRKQQRT